MTMESIRLRREGKLADSAAAADRSLALERKTFGGRLEELAISLDYTADSHALVEDYATARKLRAESLPIYVKLFGEDHRRTIDARLALDRATLLERLNPDERRELARGKELNNKFVQLFAAGRYREALASAHEATEISRKLLGPSHPEYATGLDNEAFLYKSLGDLAKADQLATDAVAIYKQAVGEKHPYYAGALDILAEICTSRGDYAQAEPLYRQALAIRKALFGTRHPDYARSLNNLAVLLDLEGDYAKAEPLYRQALDIRKATLGEKHPLYATTLHNLAGLYASIGDFQKSEPLYRQALAIRKEALGEQHPDYAATMNDLAGLYRWQRDDARAEPLYRQALAIRKATFGDKHPVYAASLNNLGLLYLDMRRFEQAEPLLTEALAISRSGGEPTEYASSLRNVAALYRLQNQFAKAMAAQDEALQIDRRVRGRQSIFTAEDSFSLGVLYQLSGDDAKASQLILDALHVYRDQLELTAPVQSERQQLLLLKDGREILRSFLSAGDGAKLPVDQIYAEVLTWKGSIAVRQQAIRQLAAAGKSPETAKLVAELKQKSRALAKLSLSVTESGLEGDHRDRLAQLTDDVEQAQRALAARSAAFRNQLDLRQVTPAGVQRSLPESAALVDILEYFRYLQPEERTGKSHWDFRLAAFVVRNKSIERVELGPVLPIYETIRMWRRAFVPLTADEAPEATDPVPRDKAEVSRRLRELIWDKLEPHLTGVKTVLISPDGITARFPWPAMPGRKPGSFLIEELAIGVVPIPRLLAQLPADANQGAKTPTSGKRTSSEPSLLIVGDVNYDAESSPASDSAIAMTAPLLVRSGQLLHWQPLEGTRTEMAGIADSFEQTFPEGKLDKLRGDRATKAALVADMEAHRYVHLATHGFFSPKELKSALDSGSAPPQDSTGQGSTLRSLKL